METERVTQDYHDFTTQSTPAAERQRLNVGDIWINSARCEECGDEIRSRNRYDFRRCSCGAIAVDGGSWYARRSFKREASFENIIVPFDDVYEDLD